MAHPFQDIAQHFPDPFRLIVRDSTHSTNDALRDLGRAGAEDGLVLLALEQTAGRGRRGADWFCPPGDALAFSVLLRPEEPKAQWPRLALATGLAVAEAAEAFGCQVQIKWPNDLWINRRKIAGILVEADADFVIVGIGINVHSTPFPEELESIATSMDLRRGDEVRAGVLEAIIRRLALRRRQIGSDFKEVMHAVRQRCALTGHRVSLITSKGPVAGTVVGLGEHGELRLETPQGIQSWIQADEVRILD